MEQIIYLDPSDDALSVRDRVETAEAKRVLLVIPPDSDTLQRRLDLQIIQRRAKRCGVELALVTTDGLIRRQAHEIGLPVFDSVEMGRRKKRWRAPAEEFEVGPPPRNDEVWTAAAQRGVAQVRASRHPGLRMGLAWLLVGLIAGVFVFAAALTVPSARIVLIPRSETVSTKLNLVVDPNIRAVDYARSRIPATPVYVEIEGNAQVATSGQKDIPAARASGKVVFVNQLSAPVTISKGTAVRTSAYGTAIRFVTVADATVPGGFGAQIEVPIEAVELGAAGNVPASLINEVEGVAGLAVRVSNPQPTSGGGVKSEPSVTQADKDRLRAALIQQLQQRAYAQLQSKLAEQEYILPESLATTEVLDETYDHFVTEASPSLGLQMRVQVSALKVGMEDANALVYAALAGKVRPGYELISNGLGFAREETLIPADKNGNLQMVMRGAGYSAARLDLNAVRKTIAGRPVEQARAALLELLPLQADPTIEVWPDWFGRIPFLTFRTQVEVTPQG